MDVEIWQQSLEKINYFHRQQDYFSALKLIKSLLVRYPYSVDLLIRYAKLIQLLDNKYFSQFPSLDIAFYALNLAYSFAPHNPEACIELGYFEYAVLDHSEKAITYFENAKNQAKSALKAALTGQIKCYIDLRCFSEARNILEDAKKIFPDDNEFSLINFELEDFELNL